MDFFSSLISPIPSAFFVIIIGYYIGRIKIYGFSLDLAGILIVAVAAGYLISLGETSDMLQTSSELSSNMNFFSSLGTALFVSSIGILAGYSINVKKADDFKAGLVGGLMICTAFIVLQIISRVDNSISFSKLIGAWCGALTTTPGLSAVCELNNIVVEEAMIGYGVTYIFGVVITIIFVQGVARKYTVDFCFKDKSENKEIQTGYFKSVIQIGVVALTGIIIGKFDLFGIGFSLGNSGGMLCIGILVGVIVKRLLPQKMVDEDYLGLIRNLGLSLFLVGNGILAGMQLSKGIELKILFYGIVMTIFSVVFGSIFYTILFRNDKKLMSTVIAGGMTSTPAIALLMQTQKIKSLSQYSVSYVVALIMIILFIRLGNIQLI